MGLAQQEVHHLKSTCKSGEPDLDMDSTWCTSWEPAHEHDLTACYTAGLLN